MSAFEFISNAWKFCNAWLKDAMQVYKKKDSADSKILVIQFKLQPHKVSSLAHNLHFKAELKLFTWISLK